MIIHCLITKKQLFINSKKLHLPWGLNDIAIFARQLEIVVPDLAVFHLVQFILPSLDIIGIFILQTLYDWVEVID